MFGSLVFATLYLIVIVFLLALQIRELMKSVTDSLYRYKNVILIGSVLFVFVYTISFLTYYLSCIKTMTEPNVVQIFHMFLAFPDSFSYIAIPVLGIICLALFVSNIALIRHEGLRAKNVLSAVLAFVFIGSTIAVKNYSDLTYEYFVVSSDYSNRALIVSVHTGVVAFVQLMICYFECMFFGTVVMGYITAKHRPSYDNDFIIILGCSINKKGGLLPLLKARTNRAIKYAWEQEIETGKPILYVPSGGQGPNEVISEGSAMELYLLSHGAEQDEVFAEKKSRNTYENFKFSKEIIDGMKPDAKVVFATTNYHIFRSGMLARKAGVEAEGIASETKWYFWPNGFVREFFAILSMKRKEHCMVAAGMAVLCALLIHIYYIVETYYIFG